METAERDLTWEEIDAIIDGTGAPGGSPFAPSDEPDESVEVAAHRVKPRPVLRLATEQVTIDRSAGYGAMLETVETPVIELAFEYGNQRILANDARDRFFQSSQGLMQVVLRDVAGETQARCVLEGFGAVDLECLEGWAVPPDSHASYLLRCDGDVHDYCSFSAWAVPQLRELGWTVETAPGYPYRIVEGELDWFAKVEPDEQRPDWFGLELGIEMDGARVSLLPALVALLDRSHEGESIGEIASRKKRVAVALPDGRYLAVPPERLQPLLRVISELYDGEEVAPDALSFSALGAAALPRLDEVFTDTAQTLKWHGKGGRARQLGEVLTAPPKIHAPDGLKATLRSYQEEGVEWLQHLRACDVGGILADDMGLGKTLQTIAHLVIEKEAGRLDVPALVVSPTSLCQNWAREIQKFAPGLRTVVIQGPKRHALYDTIDKVDVVITSYPVMTRDEERLENRTFHMLILDEAHTIKNTRSLAHQAAKRLDARHRLCITGTPVENHLGELWALMDFLNPGLLGDELNFRRWYRVPIEHYGDEDRLAALRQQVGPYLMRRLKRDVAKELPPKTELLRPVVLSGEQRELYESIRVAAHGEVRRIIAKKGLSASTVPILDALTKLRQVCCDPRLVPMRAARRVNRSAKYEQLMALTEGQLGRGHKILIFSQFTRMLDLIARGLDEKKIGYLCLTGKSRDRQGLVDAFEGGQADVFLISLKAGGVGLTLTRADTVIHYDPWWNPSAQDQATDRAYRIGQKNPVVAYNLFVQGSVEERMLALQDKKRKLAEGVLSGGAARFAFGEDDVEQLFAPLT
ncbi:MAG: DEAD/DEAH box helicase [Sandaracinaceae bacterium]